MGITRALPLVGTLNVVLSDGTGALSTGVKIDVVLDFAGRFTSAKLMANASGSVVVDIWKTAFPSVPNVGNTITAAAKPTLVTAQTHTDNTLTGWDKAFKPGDVFRFNIDSATTVTRVLLALKFVRN